MYESHVDTGRFHLEKACRVFQKHARVRFATNTNVKCSHIFIKLTGQHVKIFKMMANKSWSMRG
jgi:hypothetical protein